MFGHAYRCSRCDFDFCSGWSHHVGGQFLTCRTCAGHFVLGDGTSSWGPKDGEFLKLVDGNGHGPPTRKPVLVRVASSGAGPVKDGVSLLQFDDVMCPTCGSGNPLTQSLEIGERCPECREGYIRDGGGCIY